MYTFSMRHDVILFMLLKKQTKKNTANHPVNNGIPLVEMQPRACFPAACVSREFAFQPVIFSRIVHTSTDCNKSAWLGVL